MNHFLPELVRILWTQVKVSPMYSRAIKHHSCLAKKTTTGWARNKMFHFFTLCIA